MEAGSYPPEIRSGYNTHPPPRGPPPGMPHTLRFATLAGVGVLLVCLISPVVVVALDAAGLELSAYRVWERLGLVALTVAAILAAPRRARLRAEERAFSPARGWLRETATGFIGALLLALMLVGWLVLLGFMRFSVDFNWADDGLMLVLIAPLGALTVAFIEEWIFRQHLLNAFRRDGGTAFAVLASSLAFATVHFFHVSRSTPAPEDSPLLGVAVLGTFLGNVLDHEAQLAFVGVFLLSTVFALARLLTGRLYLAIGLHAGFVFFNRVDGPFTSWNLQELTIWNGYRQYAAGLPGWIVFASAAGLLAFLIRRRGRQLLSLPAPAPIPVPYDSKQ